MSNYLPLYLLGAFLIALGVLVYMSVKKGASMEQAKQEKDSTDATIKIIKEKEDTNGTIHKLPGSGLDNLI